MPKSSSIRALIAAIQAEFSKRQSADDAIGQEIKKVLSLLNPLPPLTGRFPTSNHAITDYFEAALASGSEKTTELLLSIGPAIQTLPWRYSYPLRQDAPDLGARIAFAEIVGPEAPFRSEKVCLGLTLIAPKTLYPAHRHPAIELYCVAAGNATWTLNGVVREYPPGSFILHPSQGIHAMQTHEKPLLAIYSWSGADVKTTSAYTQSKQTK